MEDKDSKPRFLLLNPPGELTFHRDYFCTLVSKSRYYYHPVDIVYLTGRLDKQFEVSVIDAIADRLSFEECLEKVKEINPQYMFFLIAAPSYSGDVSFIREVKKNLPEVKIIGSGDVYREFRARALHDHDFLDAILLDFSTEDILTYLNDANGQVIDNVIYRHNGAVVEGPEKHGYGKFSLPVPRWDLFHLDEYRFPFARRLPFATILSDFGCPYSCTFCPISTLGFKLREIGEVIEEMKLVKSLGIKEFHFRDQTFGVNKKRTIELCDEMIKNGISVGWSCWSRVDVVNEELLKKMKEAGCHTIIFGIETSNEEILKEYKKNIKVTQMVDALKL